RMSLVSRPSFNPGLVWPLSSLLPDRSDAPVSTAAPSTCPAYRRGSPEIWTGGAACQGTSHARWSSLRTDRRDQGDDARAHGGEIGDRRHPRLERMARLDRPGPPEVRS